MRVEDARDVIFIIDDNAKEASRLQACISSWGLTARITTNLTTVIGFMKKHPHTVTVLIPYRWRQAPNLPLQARIHEYFSEDQVVEFGPDLWASGCPRKLQSRFPEAIEWAVSHG